MSIDFCGLRLVLARNFSVRFSDWLGVARTCGFIEREAVASGEPCYDIVTFRQSKERGSGDGSRSETSRTAPLPCLYLNNRTTPSHEIDIATHLRNFLRVRMERQHWTTIRFGSWGEFCL